MKVSEHTSPYDKPSDSTFKEQTVGTIQLNKEQIDSLRKALPLAKDESGNVSQDCIFNEHHAIVIKDKNGDVLTLIYALRVGNLR